LPHPLDHSSDPATEVARLAIPGTTTWAEIRGARRTGREHTARGRTDFTVPRPQSWQDLGNDLQVPPGWGGGYADWTGTSQSVNVPVNHTLVVIGGGVMQNTHATDSAACLGRVAVGLVPGVDAYFNVSPLVFGSPGVNSWSSLATWHNTTADGNYPVVLQVANAFGTYGTPKTWGGTGWLLAMVF
jgi:hypothetical protein